MRVGQHHRIQGSLDENRPGLLSVGAQALRPMPLMKKVVPTAEVEGWVEELWSFSGQEGRSGESWTHSVTGDTLLRLSSTSQGPEGPLLLSPSNTSQGS